MRNFLFPFREFMTLLYKIFSLVPEKDYEFWLKVLYFCNTGKVLNLDNPVTFNEKIQWLKIYDATPLKTRLTDKLQVRDWVKERIGEKYLKPVFQVCETFDDIDFGTLPNSFIIKTNHGCKWHFIIKDKNTFLKNSILKNCVKKNFSKWLSMSYHLIAGFEMQYKNIIPSVFVEKLMLDEASSRPVEIEIYCFNGIPTFYHKIKYTDPPQSCVYMKNFKRASLCFRAKYCHFFEEADSLLREAVSVSKILSKDFIFVRCDFLVYNGNIYFNEMTFTPFSGYNNFPRKDADYFIGQFINLQS